MPARELRTERLVLRQWRDDDRCELDHPKLPPGHRVQRHVLYRIGRPEGV